MDRNQADHIRKNLPRLIECTKDLSQWFSFLLAYNLLSQETWESINNKQCTTHSRVRELYLECLKTPRYDDLIQSLKDSCNNTAANVLEQLISMSKSDLIWFSTQHSTNHFKGRCNEIQSIKNICHKHFEDKSSTFVVITGLGGVGKSELAKQIGLYFYKKIRGHCIWINSESIQIILDTFKTLARKLKVLLVDSEGKDKNYESLFCDIYQELCSEKCLFVFDNIGIDKYQNMCVVEFLIRHSTSLPPNTIKPFVILTSRYKLLGQGFGELAEHFHLDVLSEEDAIEFFISALKIVEDREEIRDDIKSICMVLKCYPLSMQQAVAFIKENTKNCRTQIHSGINNYLKIFKKDKKTLLGFNLPLLKTLDNSTKTTLLTLQITLDFIKLRPPIGQRAQTIMEIISFLCADNIPVKLVTYINHFMSSDRNPNITTGQILKLLDDYSVCHLRKNEKEETVSLHRLVQEVTRLQLSEIKMLGNRLKRLLDIVYHRICTKKNSLNEIIHFKNLWNHALEPQHRKLVDEYKALPEEICLQYYDAGRLREEGAFILETVKRFGIMYGEDDKSTLRMQYYKGITLQELAEYTESFQILQYVYEKQKQLFGECDRQTLETAREIAELHLLQMQLDLAKEWISYTLEKAHNCLGEDVDVTLDLNVLIARTFMEQGNYSDALNTCHKILPLQERCFGENNLRTLGTKLLISLIQYYQGEYNEALKCTKEILPIAIKKFGNDHPFTLTSKNNIALFYQSQARFEESLELLDAFFPNVKRYFGVHSRYTLTVQSNIAIAHGYMGRYEEALKLLEEVLPVQTNILGMDHPDVLLSKNNIAYTYMQQGMYDDAYKMYEQIIPILESKLESNHRQVIQTKGNLALLCVKMADFDKATQLFQELEPVCIKVFGENNPMTLTLKGNNALLFMDLEKYFEALEIFEQVLPAQIEVMGREHKDTMIVQSNIMLIYTIEGKYNEAITIYGELILQQKRVLGSNHPDVLITMSNIASTYRYIGDYEATLRIYDEILPKLEQVLGKSHPNTISAKMDAAEFYLELKEYNQALKHYEELFSIQCCLLGYEHPNVLNIKEKVAISLSNLGRYEDALTKLDEILQTQQHVPGIYREKILMTKYRMASVYRCLNQNRKALSIYFELLPILVQHKGKTHADSLDIRFNIAEVQICLNKHKEAFMILVDSLAPFIDVFGVDHPYTKKARYTLANLLTHNDKHEEIHEIYKDLLPALERSCGCDHRDYLTCKENIDILNVKYRKTCSVQ